MIQVITDSSQSEKQAKGSNILTQCYMEINAWNAKFNESTIHCFVESYKQTPRGCQDGQHDVGMVSKGNSIAVASSRSFAGSA